MSGQTQGVKSPPLRGYRRRKTVLDLNVPPIEGRDDEGTSTTRIEPPQGVQASHQRNGQGPSLPPPTIDVDAIDDDDDDVIESSPRAIAQAKNNSRRAAVVDVESGGRFTHNKRRRVPPNQTIINCDLYINLEGGSSSSSSKRENVQTLPPKEPTFNCPICLCPLVEEMSTKCGHIFCKTCISDAIKRQAKCPTCRKRVTTKELITSKHMLAIHPKPKPRLRSWQPPIVANLQTISSLPFKTRVCPATKTTNTLNESNETERSSAGKIKRLVLSKEGRTKLNSYPDREFYSYPRFVTHVDDGFISTLTNLYQEMLRPDSEILDLMSSWVSHLPKQAVYKRIVGHGLNAQELARNPRLDYFFVKDLNQDQKLELESSSFDAVLCTVSVQYLQQPEKVFAEVFRVLRPGGVFIVSFSNRLFYEKAISAWRDGTGYSRVQLVVQYFQCVEGFTQAEIIRKLPAAAAGPQQEKSPFSWIMRLLGLVSGSDPFYAVVAYKNFKPVYE